MGNLYAPSATQDALLYLANSGEPLLISIDSHAHPHALLCQTRLGRGGLLLSGNRALTVQVM